MQPFPHHYHVRARGGATGDVRIASNDLPELATQAPPAFEGPGGYWSPETLLTAAVADCFILTFRAVARANGLEWSDLDCGIEALLERPEHVTRFTRFTIRPHLIITSADDEAIAHRCLEKAERGCLVANSLNAEMQLEPRIEVAEQTRA